MADQAKRQQRRNEEDAVFNRMLLWLVGAVLAEALVLVVKRLYVDFKATDLGISIAAGLMSFFHVFTFVGLALTVLGVIWCLSVRKKQKGLRLAVGCTVALGFLWVVALLCWRLYDTGVKLLVALPIAAAVLILIWFLYQKAFFCSAVITACGLALLWVFRQHGGSRSVGITVVFVTHDIDEALFLADRVLIMSPRPGRILESLRVAFARPRRRELVAEPDFVRLKRHCLELLRPSGSSHPLPRLMPLGFAPETHALA